MRSIAVLLLLSCSVGCQLGKPAPSSSVVRVAPAPASRAEPLSPAAAAPAAGVQLASAEMSVPADISTRAHPPPQQAAGQSGAIPPPDAHELAQPPSEASLLVPEAATGIAAQPAAQPPDGGWTLDSILETALAENPDMVTLRGQVNVTRAVGGVTRAYPWNPFIQSQYFPNGHPFAPNSNPTGAAGQSNYYIWVMQRFELAHQRQYRKQIASAMLTQAQWNVQQAELLSVALTMRLYFTALYQRELFELASETAEINARLLGVAQRRFKANLGTPADLTAAKVAARQSRRQADLAEATYQAALLAVRQQMNLRLDQPLPLAHRLTDYAWASVHGLESLGEADAASAESLAAELVQARPDLMAACAGMRVASANALLARAARVPDIAAGPIYETADDGTQYLGLRFQTDVPILNTGAPFANQRRAELKQQELTYSQLHRRAVLEAQAAIDRYERARRLVEKAAADPTLAGGNIPQELREITALFEAGQVEVVAVFATQANLLQDRRTYLDLLNETALAAAGVVQAAAFPPDRLATIRSGEIIARPAVASALQSTSR